MTKRIFSKCIWGEVETLGDHGEAPDVALATFIAEEDIEVIGVELQGYTVGLVDPGAGNSGLLETRIGVTSSPIGTPEGVIARLTMQCWIDATLDKSVFGSKEVVVMFPEGKAMTVREEGVITLSAGSISHQKGIQYLNGLVYIYYTKKNAR